MIDGRAIARRVWDEVKGRCARFHDRLGARPRLAIVRGSGDPGSDSYLRQIVRAFGEAGIDVSPHVVEPSTAEDDLRALVSGLSADRTVHGVLVQLPLPAPHTLDSAVRWLDPSKDVEGVHPTNAGLLAQGRPAAVPSTPLAGLEILDAEGVDPAGLRCVVVGRSPIVGRPLALLLLNRHATVTICHTRTRDLPAVAREADVLLVAAGRPGLLDAQAIRPGAVVIDFGVNALDGRLVGDVDFESARQVAGAITPVPGGTGPVTTAILGRNLIDLAERQAIPTQ